MYEALKRVAADMKFKSPDSPIGHKDRVQAVCAALADTAAVMEDEIPRAASEIDIANLKTLSQGFRAAHRLVEGLHDNVDE
ncbi:hypothetical protein LJR230_002190 [Trinickia sp. LjRoot230]|uniref:hypothetical protein n=1 Tax=Trinickia sp. LjRoot230 TaxID=3342288 RepID=UPI003ECFD7B5